MDETKYAPEARETDDEFPGWTTWFSSRAHQWHGRLDHSDPLVMVHDDTLEGLRRQIREQRS
jgi:hypothetical protein